MTTRIEDLERPKAQARMATGQKKGAKTPAGVSIVNDDRDSGTPKTPLGVSIINDNRDSKPPKRTIDIAADATGMANQGVRLMGEIAEPLSTGV